jgi:hypothetical protein
VRGTVQTRIRPGARYTRQRIVYDCVRRAVCLLSGIVLQPSDHQVTHTVPFSVAAASIDQSVEIGKNRVTECVLRGDIGVPVRLSVWSKLVNGTPNRFAAISYGNQPEILRNAKTTPYKKQSMQPVRYTPHSLPHLTATTCQQTGCTVVLYLTAVRNWRGGPSCQVKRRGWSIE